MLRLTRERRGWRVCRPVLPLGMVSAAGTVMMLAWSAPFALASGWSVQPSPDRGTPATRRGWPAHAMRALALALAVSALLGIATPAFAAGPPPLQKAYTEHLGQLITAPGRGGVNELNSHFNGTLGMRGTDLGVSFEGFGGLYFLFGDSWVMGRGTLNDDSMAETYARSVERFQMPQLTWAHGIDGSFAPLRVVRLSQGRLEVTSHGGMEVPVEGIQTNGRIYVFFVSGYHEDTGGNGSYDYRVLGHFGYGTRQTGRFYFDEQVPTQYFLNVSAVKYGGYIYVFGAGNPYRQSAVRLARFRPQAIAHHEQWSYYRPTLAKHSAWVPGAYNATPIVEDNPPCIGELSVRQDPTSGYFLMAYGCNDNYGTRPRGYYLRMARYPWGPWSTPIYLFDSSPGDSGYGVTQHITTDGGKYPDDGLAEPDSMWPGGRDTFGGEYGPYLIPRFFRSQLLARRPGCVSHVLHQVSRNIDCYRLSIVYTHSTRNPYKVHLMRTVLVPRGSIVPAPPRLGAGLPLPAIRNGNFDSGISGWAQLGTPFRVVTLEGRHYVSSYVPQGPGEQNGDDAQGALYQDFTLDDRTTTLCFRVHGGGVLTPGDFEMRNVASVRLYHGNEIVRESFGWNSDAYQDVRWNIHEFAGEPLRLVIADNATGPWGFIDATGFRLAGNNCGAV